MFNKFIECFLNAASDSDDKVSDIVNLFNASDDASDILMVHHQNACSDSSSTDRENQKLKKNKTETYIFLADIAS